jgi:Cu/Ag efflux protein CusF
MQKWILMSAAAVLLTASTLAAQSKVVPGETRELTGTIAAIDPAARQVTVRRQDGTAEILYVPETVKRFDSLKVGQRIHARHYENMVLRLQQPGQKPVDANVRDAATAASQGTGGTLAHQRTITATISEIDMNAPSVTITGPGGFKYSSKVKDKNALAKVKVGDKVDITWTEATTVSIEDAK